MEELLIDVSYSGNNDEIVIIRPQGYIDTTTVHLIEETLDEQLAKNKDNTIKTTWTVFNFEFKRNLSNWFFMINPPFFDLKIEKQAAAVNTKVIFILIFSIS